MPDRALMPDYLRLFALFGIVVVNVQAMAYPVVEGFAGASIMAAGDEVAVWLVDGLAYFKTYGLFSFMFGVGLAFQMRSAERRKLPFGPIYRNRMIGLILLGLLHGCLFFPYDILVLYAITGTILYFMRNWAVRSLVRCGAALLLLHIPLATAILIAPAGSDELIAVERSIMTEGSFIDAVILRSITFLSILPILLILQGVAALGWFCLGLAAVKSGLIDRPDHPLWRRARRLCLLPGVMLSLVGAALWQWGPYGIGVALTVAAAPVASLGYLGGIAALARPPSPRMRAILQAGGASLSVYLGQSILLSTIFSAYGLGLWDAVGPLSAIGISLAVTAALILALVLWRQWFALGPFEWILRRITRIGVTPVRPVPS